MQMDNRLYKLMDWPSIEEIVYSESSHPKRILGGHRVKEGFLIQVFRPDAVQIGVSVSERKKNVQMEKVDDAGFFAALIPLKKSVKYVLNIEDKQGHTIRCTDPYSMEDYEDTDTLFNKFIEGTEDKAYRLFGGHECEKDGVSGTLFRTWAPYALRVSVVGDFNNWDGRIYQMERITENGIYELFIPGLCAGTEYMYEMKFHGRETAIKADPYAMEATRYADAHSVVTKSDVTDKSQAAKSTNTGAAKKKTFAKSVNKGAVSVLEVKLKDIADIIGTDAAYGTIADKLIEYVKAAGYTHIQIMSDDGVFSHKGYSYAAASYYVPLTKYGSAEDFKQLVNSLHKAGIGVILEWNGAYFGSDMRGIVNFDGGSCYGYLKPRLDKKPYREVTTFAYDKGEVRSFLISNLSMWLDEYDIDGIRLDVAYCLDFEFLKRLRCHTDSLKKDFFLVGEMLHGDYNQRMNDEMLHSATNYECYKGLYSSFNSMNMFEINHSLLRQFGPENWTLYKGKHLLCFVDNHDVTRVASILTNENHLPLIYALLFGMPGIPCVYYGSEWGAKADKSQGDPALRPSFKEPEFNELSEFISKLADIKKNSKALNYGDFTSTVLTNKQCVFRRSTGDETVYVAINADDQEYTAYFGAEKNQVTDLLSGAIMNLDGGLKMAPYSAYFLA
mgnify:CR=1 FL=1